MDKEIFNELADKLALNLKSEEDVSEMARMLTKVAIERESDGRIDSANYGYP